MVYTFRPSASHFNRLGCCGCFRHRPLYSTCKTLQARFSSLFRAEWITFYGNTTGASLGLHEIESPTSYRKIRVMRSADHFGTTNNCNGGNPAFSVPGLWIRNRTPVRIGAVHIDSISWNVTIFSHFGSIFTA